MTFLIITLFNQGFILFYIGYMLHIITYPAASRSSMACLHRLNRMNPLILNFLLEAFGSATIYLFIGILYPENNLINLIYFVTEIREKELKYLGGRKYLDAMCVYFWATTPVLISILTFTVYVYTGHELTAPVVSYTFLF